jgi:hypothetical protein
MIDLGLSAANMKKLLNLLVNNHRISIKVQVLDLNHNYLSDVSTRLLSGQITVDTTAEVTRVLQVELLDPNYSMNIEAESPEEGSLFMDRMIRVVYTVADVMLTESYDIPVFCGPITKLDRTFAVVTLECSGKEKLANGGFWTAKTYKKGLTKTAVIRAMLRDIAGETKMDIPEVSSAKLPSNLTLSRDKAVWASVKTLTGGLSRVIFYDGRGVAKMLNPGGSVRYTFTMPGAILTQPQINYDVESLFNAVEYTGAKPKGHKNPVRGTAVAPKAHILSPQSLGRNGIPRYLIERVQDDSLRTNAACKAAATRRLEKNLLQAVTVTFDALPIPVIEEHDVCALRTENYSVNFLASKFVIPLVAGASSSIGYTRNVAPNKQQIRKK